MKPDVANQNVNGEILIEQLGDLLVHSLECKQEECSDCLRLYQAKQVLLRPFN